MPQWGKTHWGKIHWSIVWHIVRPISSARAPKQGQDSLRQERTSAWNQFIENYYDLWKFRPIKIISGQISHIFSYFIFIR